MHSITASLKTDGIRNLLSWLHAKGFFSLLSANFLTQFLGFGTALLVARFLTPVELGEVRILQSYTAVFCLLATCGLSTAILKFCAENREQREKESMLRTSLLLAMAATIVVLLLVWMLSWTGVLTKSAQLARWFVIYAITIPVSVVTSLLMVYLQALKRVNEMARAQTLIRMEFFVLIVVSAWLWRFPGFVMATIVAYAVGLLPLFRQVGLRFLRSLRTPLPAGFIDVSLFSLLGGGVTALSQYGDVFFLDHYNPDRAAIGYYSLALTFITAAMQVTGTVQTIITPHFSERSGDEAWVRTQLAKNQFRMTGLSILVAAGVYVLAWGLLRVFFAPRFAPTLTYLAVLLIRYVLWSSYAVIGGAFVGLGLIRYGFYLVSVSTPLGLVLTYSMLKRFGVIGVAWGQVLAMAITLVLMLATYQRQLRNLYGRNRVAIDDQKI